MPPRGTGLAGELGFTRRENRSEYDRVWRERNRDKFLAYSKEYHHNVIKKDPEKLAAKNLSASFARRKKKYGISREDYAALLTGQQNQCRICRTEFKDTSEAKVDHDHETLQVRGLLCSQCNTGLGSFRDSPDFLRNAAAYLEQSQPRS